MASTDASLRLVLVDSAVWATWSLVVGYLAHRLPYAWLRHDSWLTHLRPWERGGGIYTRTGVTRWKDIVPDAGAVFRGGSSKRSLPGRTDDDLQRFAEETRRAELVHWAVPAITPAFALWNPPGLLLAMAIYAIIANVPCLVIQRFNRGRILRILARRTRAGRSVAQMPRETNSAG